MEGCKLSSNAPQFKSWIKGVQEKINKHYDAHFTNLQKPRIIFKEGPKYIKIIEEGPSQRTSFAFIDKCSGDVLKSATWNAPAKHARGNIFDEWNGLKWVGPYGMAYLK